MAEKYVKVDDIVEYCTTYSACLQNKGQSVAQAALRRVKEFAKENATDVQLVVHGYWEECEIRGTLTQSCSVCGNDCGVLYPYDFCPNCGARMDLKDGDAE